MNARAILAAVIAVAFTYFILISGREKPPSDPPANRSDIAVMPFPNISTAPGENIATGESWTCAKVGYRNEQQIEGLRLRLEAMLVSEGASTGRINKGPVFLQRQGEKALTRSTGRIPVQPAGHAVWGMTDSAAQANGRIVVRFKAGSGAIPVDVFDDEYGTDDEWHLFEINLLTHGGSFEDIWFSDCTSTQVTVSLYKPTPD